MKKNDSLSVHAYRPLIILAALVLVVGALYWAQKVLIPLVLAVLFTFILAPLVSYLQRHGLRRVPSSLLVVVLASVLLGGIGWILTAQLRELAGQLPQHKDLITRKIASLQGSGSGVVGNLIQMVKDIGDDVQRTVAGEPQAPPADQPIPVVIHNGQPTDLGWFSVFITPLLETLASAGLVIVLVIFMLIYREDLRNRMIRLVGNGRLTSTTRAIDDATQRISRFLMLQVVINICFGAALGLSLFLIGVPYATLWGLLGGLLRFIPYIGSWVGGALVAVFSFAVFPGWREPLLALGIFVVLELLAANVVEPLLFGHGTGVSPVALLVAAAFWAWLWGPIGLILSTPITVCLLVLGKYVPGLAFLGVLLGDEPSLETEISFYQRLLARDQDEASDLVDEYLQEHPPETIYDELFLPALVLAKRDQQQGALNQEDEQWILQTTREFLDDLGSTLPEKSGMEEATGGETDGSGVLVLGCPAEDQFDELALRMFEHLFVSATGRMEVLSSATLASEVLTRIRQQQPRVVCIAALPPGGLAQTRYLCKRLRRVFPELKIVVGRWGLTQERETAEQRLRSAGANAIVTTLLEAREQILPLVQALSHVEAPRELVTSA